MKTIHGSKFVDAKISVEIRILKAGGSPLDSDQLY